MRGKRAPKRDITPDRKHNSPLVAKLVNYVMRKGKKMTAERIVYGAFDIIKEKTNRNPLEVYEAAIKNVSPVLEIRSKRVGGANYQVPIPVRAERRLSLALRWVIGAAQSKKGRPIAARLADELIAASQGEGEAVKKRQDVQRMAEANRAFAHFARF